VGDEARDEEVSAMGVILTPKYHLTNAPHWFIKHTKAPQAAPFARTKLNSGAIALQITPQNQAHILHVFGAN